LTTAGRPKEALQLVERALNIRRKEYPADHPLLAATRAEYAATLISLGRLDEAEPLLLPSFEVLRKQDNRRSRRTRQALVDLYVGQGNPKLAGKYRRK
jgi:thioredoxin-like negative regulator of GroEL